VQVAEEGEAHQLRKEFERRVRAFLQSEAAVGVPAAIASFLEREEVVEVSLSPSLTKEQRAAVHAWADLLDLDHSSVGVGARRQLRLRKPLAASGAVMEAVVVDRYASLRGLAVDWHGQRIPPALALPPAYLANRCVLHVLASERSAECACVQ